MNSDPLAQRTKTTRLAILGLLAALAMPVLGITILMNVYNDRELPTAINLLVCGGTALWMGCRSAFGRSARGRIGIRVLGWITILFCIVSLPFSIPACVKM